ncbi:histidine kinase [Polaribacter sejongensis]|uniref:sensor histidine kinase n=1 Tax=Polaribacter sejongensis TaxID=985043 RepID=UPI0035A6DAA7
MRDNFEATIQNQKRQHDLELKALRSQMNPHFVHNSLNAIQYYIQQNDVETSENYLAKFSKLMRQFFDYSRRKSVSLSEEISLLENYLQIEKLRFEEKIEYEIKVDPELDIEEEQIPSMLIQPLVENAINHGLFHKKGMEK